MGKIYISEATRAIITNLLTFHQSKSVQLFSRYDETYKQTHRLSKLLSSGLVAANKTGFPHYWLVLIPSFKNSPNKTRNHLKMSLCRVNVQKTVPLGKSIGNDSRLSHCQHYLQASTGLPSAKPSSPWFCEEYESLRLLSSSSP